MENQVINQEFISNIFRNIEKRNEEAVQVIIQEKREFDENTKKIIRFIQFQNKIDKIEAAYFLMTSEKERKKIEMLTNSTKKEIWEKALMKANGNQKKAISLIFDPSCKI